MVRITKVHTGGGDLGETSLVDGSRVSKSDARIEIVGTCDEVNALLGVALMESNRISETHPDGGERITVRRVKGVCSEALSRLQSELFDLVEPYRRKDVPDCIVPFSGGRDSCYGLHLIVKELKMKPITYTYDWGMVTDLGRRNISRMCSELQVENIIVAADISKKRRNIAKH